MRTSLFHFLPRALLLVHHDRVVLGKTTHCLKGKGGATSYCQHITGGAKEGTIFDKKVEAMLSFHIQIYVWTTVLSSQFRIEGNTEVWDIITC